MTNNSHGIEISIARGVEETVSYPNPKSLFSFFYPFCFPSS